MAGSARHWNFSVPTRAWPRVASPGRSAWWWQAPKRPTQSCCIRRLPGSGTSVASRARTAASGPGATVRGVSAPPQRSARSVTRMAPVWHLPGCWPPLRRCRTPRPRRSHGSHRLQQRARGVRAPHRALADPYREHPHQP